MRELTVIIKMSEATYKSFRKDTLREAKKVGFPLEEKEVIEIDEEFMMTERTHATVYTQILAGIAACDLAQQVDNFYRD